MTASVNIKLSLSEGLSLPLALVLFNSCFVNEFFTDLHTLFARQLSQLEARGHFLPELPCLKHGVQLIFVVLGCMRAYVHMCNITGGVRVKEPTPGRQAAGIF